MCSGNKIINRYFRDPFSPHYVPMFRGSGTIILAGYLVGAFYTHSGIVSIIKGNKDPKNNTRDITLGYVLMTVTFVFFGICFYLIYPGWKLCIADNFINVSSEKS